MRGTILIVDDEKPTREGLRQSLEDEFDVYTAGTVDEALKVLDADYIDLVLTDLRLGRRRWNGADRKGPATAPGTDLHADDRLRLDCHRRRSPQTGRL